MLSEPEENDYDHEQGSASVRLLEINRQAAVNCGFHLTRSKWDPYPWVSAVDIGSAAEVAGVHVGDCVLEVNGEDVLGRRIGDIAEVVRLRSDQVSLLLWNAGVNPLCKPESLCCGPMPLNMQRLSTCLSAILSSMECSICLDTIPPPANQCVNGHLICARCHSKSERCPVCRIRISRGRSLFADQVYNSITDAFELSKLVNDKIRTTSIKEIFHIGKKNKNNQELKITHSHTNRFLERNVEKASSAENLSNHLSPRTFLSEFHSNLKAKSLSTSEIFSPSSSNTPRIVFQDENKIIMPSRMQCGRSFESVDSTSHTSINQTNSTSSCNTNQLLYYCPFSNDCTNRIKGDMITQHFQEVHDGPLILYFKQKITFNLLNSHDTFCIVHNSGKKFFLKINTINKNNSMSSNEFHDTLIWIWFLGDQCTASKYELQMQLYVSSCPEKVLLSLNSAIYSLHTTSWEDVTATHKGVFLCNDIIKTICVKSSDITVQVQIK